MVAQRQVRRRDVGNLKVVIGAVVTTGCAVLRPAFAFPSLLGGRLARHLGRSWSQGRLAERRRVGSIRLRRRGFRFACFVRLKERIVSHRLINFLRKIQGRKL